MEATSCQSTLAPKRWSLQPQGTVIKLYSSCTNNEVATENVQGQNSTVQNQVMEEPPAKPKKKKKRDKNSKISQLNNKAHSTATYPTHTMLNEKSEIQKWRKKSLQL